uniref:Putative acetoacetate reductase n=1 Tax=Streptomyces griseus subsp. griseus TaxID=67263 RepID=Q9XDF1_STRGR|nr:putative acetoacetate reductase [Streptomyces griseus subsp. griseus]
MRSRPHDLAAEDEPFREPHQGLVARSLGIAVDHGGPDDHAVAGGAFGLQFARRAHRAQQPPERGGAAPAAAIVGEAALLVRLLDGAHCCLGHGSTPCARLGRAAPALRARPHHMALSAGP